jgi:arsenate reductase
MSEIQIYPELAKAVNGFRSTFKESDFYSRPMRRIVRQEISAGVSQAQQEEKVLALNFICTHNSRRSQIAQIWTTVAAAWHDNEFITAYSGGTEVTALHPNVITALSNLGFKVEDDGGNPGRYLVYFSDDYPPVKCWSKRYDDANNPEEDFLAIMVCDDADANCPVIPTARKRIALRYIDPKFSDGTNKEMVTYKRTTREIGSEVFSLF